MLKSGIFWNVWNAGQRWRLCLCPLLGAGSWWKRNKAFETEDFVALREFGDGAGADSSVLKGTVDIIDFVFGFFVDEKDVFAFFGTDKVANLDFLSVGYRDGVGRAGEEVG